jgi:hypothetical protein
MVAEKNSPVAVADKSLHHSNLLAPWLKTCTCALGTNCQCHWQYPPSGWHCSGISTDPRKDRAPNNQIWKTSMADIAELKDLPYL